MGKKKSSENPHEIRIREFDLNNHDLAFLASDAAVYFDNIIEGRDTEDGSILYLSKLLEEATRKKVPYGKKPLAASWQNVLVLAYAISSREQFESYWEGKGEDDVVVQTNLVAKELRNYRSLPVEKQKNLMYFCRRLSREAGDHFYNNCSWPSRLSA